MEGTGRGEGGEGRGWGKGGVDKGGEEGRGRPCVSLNFP